VIAYSNGAPVRIRDIGRAIDAPENNKVAAWANGKRTICLRCSNCPAQRYRNGGSGEGIPGAPSGRHPAIGQSRRPQRPDADHPGFGCRCPVHVAVTVALVGDGDFLFLRSLRATLIPSIAVPLALVGTFGVMYGLATASTICL